VTTRARDILTNPLRERNERLRDALLVAAVRGGATDAQAIHDLTDAIVDEQNKRSQDRLLADLSHIEAVQKTRREMRKKARVD